MKKISILAFLTIASLALLQNVASLAESERVDIELRRTTLIVSDIENSLRFYRGALGFEAIFELNDFID